VLLLGWSGCNGRARGLCCCSPGRGEQQSNRCSTGVTTHGNRGTDASEEEDGVGRTAWHRHPPSRERQREGKEGKQASPSPRWQVQSCHHLLAGTVSRSAARGMSIYYSHAGWSVDIEWLGFLNHLDLCLCEEPSMNSEQFIQSAKQPEINYSWKDWFHRYEIYRYIELNNFTSISCNCCCTNIMQCSQHETLQKNEIKQFCCKQRRKRNPNNPATQITFIVPRNLGTTCFWHFYFVHMGPAQTSIFPFSYSNRFLWSLKPVWFYHDSFSVWVWKEKLFYFCNAISSGILKIKFKKCGNHPNDLLKEKNHK